MSTIVRLKAENIKRLSAVEITPTGDVVVIGGMNGNGKSSVLDAIAMALGGKEMFPPKPVRIGETEASVEVEIKGADGVVLIVKRKIKSDGDGVDKTTTIEVSEKRNGRVAKLQGPQAILNAMCGALMFDPLAFTRMKPKEQVQMLKELVGINTDDLDAEEKSLFDARKEANRDAKDAKALWEAAETYPDAPGELVSVGALVEALNEANEKNGQGARLRYGAEESLRKVRSADEEIANRNAAVIRLRNQLAEAEAEHAESVRKAAAQAEHYAAASEAAAAFVAVDTAPIRQQMEQAETINAHVRANAEEKRKRAIYEAAQAKADELTAQIEAVRQKRMELMANVKWPVPGMSFDDKGVTLNDLPFEQASSAEQLRTSVKMGFAANPELKVAFIHDGSLLDDKSMALVAEEVAAAGGQCWMERVGTDDASAIVIENGAIRAAAADAA